jgi:ABC-type glutathione transport system ATPase component
MLVENFSDEILMKISVGRSSLIILLLLALLVHFDCARTTCERSCVISGIRNFSVRYAQKPGLLRFLHNRGGEGGEGDRKEVIGTDSITAQFSGITVIVGPPGSGKSTLIKGLHLQSQEDGLATYSGGAKLMEFDTLRISAGEVDCTCSYRSAYINEFFYETYDNSKTVAKTCQTLIGACNDESGNINSEKCVSEAYRIAVESMNLPTDTQIKSLMESEKRCFEITLALMRLHSGIDRGNEQKTSEACGPSVLLLDEYLDKDNPAIVGKVISNLKRYMIASAERSMPFQMLIVTHSESVADNADWAVAIHKGSLFHEQEPRSLRLPSQHVWR